MELLRKSGQEGERLNVWQEGDVPVHIGELHNAVFVQAVGERFLSDRCAEQGLQGNGQLFRAVAVQDGAADLGHALRHGEFGELRPGESIVADGLHLGHFDARQGGRAVKRRIFYGNDIRERYGCDSTLVKGIASDGLHSGHDDLGQAVGIPECVFSDFRHTLRQIHGDNSACVKGVLSDAGNTVGDGHRGDIFFPDEHMSPDGGDAGIPRNIHLCVVPAVPLQDAVQDDEVAVYHLDDPIFLRTAELLAVYIDDGFDLAAVLGLVGDREAGAGGAGHAVDNSVGEVQGFPTFSAFSLNSQLAIAQGNVPVHAGYGKRIGRGGIGCAHFPKSVCIHALTE